DERDLRGRRRVGGPGDLVRAAELLERLVDAGVLELLIGVAELLRDRDRLQPRLERRIRIGPARSRRRRGSTAASRRPRRLVLSLSTRGETKDESSGSS